MFEKIKDDYDAWAHQYDIDANPTRDLDKIVTIESLSKIDFSNVLEIGCGTGKNTEWLITKADSLVGLDFSKNMLDVAMGKVKSSKVTFIKANLNQEWPVDDNSFDGLGLVKDIANLYREHMSRTQVLAASLRNVKDVAECFSVGADVVTMPPAIFGKMYNHILTDKGLQLFQDDWNSIKKD